MTSLISHIELSIEKAENLESNITPEVLEIEGPSDVKTRHFYNNLCSMDDTRYLAIDNITEECVCSALSNNSINCVTITDLEDECMESYLDPDNKDGIPKSILNLKKYSNNCTYNYNNLKWQDDDLEPLFNESRRFNVYTNSSSYTDKSVHRESLKFFLGCLSDEFIYIVNNWNESGFKESILENINDNNLEISYQNELSNGLGIFVLKQVTSADDEF